MAIQMSLANHFLVAKPFSHDIIFEQSVIYICEHHVQGTIGLIINRPTPYTLKLIFDQLKIESNHDEMNKKPLMFGGPSQPERGFVVHRPTGHWNSSLTLLTEDVTITTSNDIIRALAENKAPKDILVILGYVGWDSNQLEQEIIRDDWLVCPFKPELLYDVPYMERWKEAAMILGFHMEQFISGGGHA